MPKTVTAAPSASSLLSVLRAGPWREPAHAWLYEVRNGTGYGKRERYADAMVISCYPSRGIWAAGIEVKVARSDWRRELDDPGKAAEIMRWCDYWYLVTPPDVVRDGEVPETWGHVIVSGKAHRIVKEAPKLAPEPWTARFGASVLRNASESMTALLTQARHEGREAERAKTSAEELDKLREQLHDAQQAVRHETHERERIQRELASVRGEVAQFESEAGVSVGIGSYRRGDMRHVGRTWKLAEMFSRLDGLAAQLRAAADALESLEKAAERSAT